MQVQSKDNNSKVHKQGTVGVHYQPAACIQLLDHCVALLPTHACQFQ